MLSAPSLYAQELRQGLLLGIYSGFNAGLHSGTIPVYAGFPGCGLFSSGVFTSPSFGIRSQFVGALGARFNLSTMLQWGSSSGRYTTLPHDPQFAPDVNDNLIELDREYRLITEFRTISFVSTADYLLTDKWSLGLGWGIGYQYDAAITQTDNVLGPGDYSFDDGQRERPMDGGETFVVRPISLSVRINTSYTFQLRNGVILVPELALGYSPLSPVEEFAWTTASVGGGVSVLFDFFPDKPNLRPPLRPDVVAAKPRTPSEDRLAATIEVYGTNEVGQRLEAAEVRVNEVLYRQFAPSVPVFFFDKNSWALPERYELIPPSKAADFTIDSLSGLDPLETYYHELNILGERLRDQPSSSIQLIGSTSGSEQPRVARARAEEVRSYLVSVWAIDSSRIAIGSGPGFLGPSSESTEDGKTENQRVDVVSTSAIATQPVITERIVREYNPPLLTINPSFEADAGLKRWTITIKKNDKVLTMYTSEDHGNAKEPELTWHITQDSADTTLAPLTAEFMVEDSTGRTYTAVSSVPLVLEKKTSILDRYTERKGENEKVFFSLVAFNFNSSILRPDNDSLLRSVVKATKPGARITVTGYTDRIGSEAYNEGLSLQRAQKVSAQLQELFATAGISDVEILSVGAGIEEQRYPNTVPEGRVMSRSVEIVIEQFIDGIVAGED